MNKAGSLFYVKGVAEGDTAKANVFSKLCPDIRTGVIIASI
mgnify:CR=1 FL=1